MEEIKCIYKRSSQIYYFLNELKANNICMKAEFRPHPDNTIVFTAFEPFYIKIVTFGHRPWHQDKTDPTAFKIIEIICDDDSQYRDFLNTFQNQPDTKQHKLIEYLQLIKHRGTSISKIKLSHIGTRTVITGFPTVGGGPAPPPATVYNWKMTCTIASESKKE